MGSRELYHCSHSTIATLVRCSQKTATLIQRFDTRLETTFSFWLSGTLALNPEHKSARKSITKNGRLASLASNPLVTVPVLELWVKMGYRTLWHTPKWYTKQKWSRGLTHVAPKKQVLDGGQGRTNPFAPRGVTTKRCGLLSKKFFDHLFRCANTHA